MKVFCLVKYLQQTTDHSYVNWNLSFKFSNVFLIQILTHNNDLWQTSSFLKALRHFVTGQLLSTTIFVVGIKGGAEIF